MGDKYSTCGYAIEHIDNYLDYLTNSWEGLDEFWEEWPTFSEDEKVDLFIDWPIKTDRLNQVRKWAALGFLTPAQQAKYEELEALVTSKQDILDKMTNW